MTSQPATDTARMIRLDGRIQQAEFSSIDWTTGAGKTNFFISGNGEISNLKLSRIKMPSANRFVQGVRIQNRTD